jgi:hypothetical protein
MLFGAVVGCLLVLAACGDDSPSASEDSDGSTAASDSAVDEGPNGETTTGVAGGLCEGAALLRDWWDIDSPSPEQLPSIEQGFELIVESAPDLADDVAIVGAPFGLGDPSEMLDLGASAEAQQRIDEVVVAECGEPIWG